MDYQVVYDLTREGYQRWWLPGIGIGLSFLLVLCIVFQKPLRRISGMAFIPLIVWGVLTINLASTGVVFIRSYGAYRTVANYVQAGRIHVVEGQVTQFKPAVPGKGQSADESFVVGSKRFVYSDSYALGFYQTNLYGGPIKDGLKVRVVYVSFDGHDVITRLEIAR